jgi:hypothetical protein
MVKLNPAMQAIADKAKEFEQYLGKTVEIQAIGANLRHIFTGAEFRIGGKVEHEFDGFLRGQLMARRVLAFFEGKQIGQAPAEIKAQAEGAGTDTSGETAPLVISMAPPKAPETPAETPEAPKEETPAPAAKTSILKKQS